VPYFGNEPAKSAIKVGDNTILSSSIADGVIINADIKSDAAIAMSKTALAAGTGITLATNTLNVDAAQTQITSVGTIGTGVWQGTKVASAYLDDDTAHLSGSAFTGTISSTTGSTTDSVLTLSDAGVADYKFTFPDTSTIRLSTSTSSDKTLDITNAGSGVFALNVEGTVTVGASNGDKEVKVNRSRMRHIDGLADASDYSHGDLYVNHISTGNIYMQRDTTFAGLTKTTKLFESAGGSGGQQAYSSSVTSSYRGGGLIRFFTDNNVSIFKLGNEASPYGGFFGTFAGYSPSGAELMILGIDGVNIGKNRNSEVIGLRCSTGGTLQSGAGAINATNADNWNLVVKSTTGGTIASNGGMAYFALGDNYTTNDAILVVRNDGNRGSFRHASGSSLIKAQFNDGTAFEVTKDGMIKGMQGAPARIAGNWEVVDVLSAEDNQSSNLQSDDCFNNNIYSQFKIVIPYINCDTANATLLFTFMYNSGSGLTEQTGDYYTSMDISPHTASSYSGGVQSDATRAELFGAMHGHLAVGVSGEMNIYDAFIADLRQYNQFTANTMRSGDGNLDGDRGANYRPMIDARFLGYNTAYSAYVSQRSMIRCNTDRHASYWKGFRIQASSGNLGAKSQIIVLGRAL